MTLKKIRKEVIVFIFIKVHAVFKNVHAGHLDVFVHGMAQTVTGISKDRKNKHIDYQCNEEMMPFFSNHNHKAQKYKKNGYIR